jgi:hypothetical protein
VFRNLWSGLVIEQAVFNQKSVCGTNRQLEVDVADVEIEKAVIGSLEVNHLTLVSTPTQFPAEAFDLVERGLPIGFPVKENHGGQLAAQVGRRAVALCGLAVWKTLGGLTAWRRVYKCAEENERLRPTVDAIH